jgi:hypothetical protein
MRLANQNGEHPTIANIVSHRKDMLVGIRGVQIRSQSESDPIGFVRISEQKYSFRIGSD